MPLFIGLDCNPAERAQRRSKGRLSVSSAGTAAGACDARLLTAQPASAPGLDSAVVLLRGHAGGVPGIRGLLCLSPLHEAGASLDICHQCQKSQRKGTSQHHALSAFWLRRQGEARAGDGNSAMHELGAELRRHAMMMWYEELYLDMQRSQPSLRSKGAARSFSS